MGEVLNVVHPDFSRAGAIEARPGPLSGIARRGKLDYFLPMVDRSARILDVGCADNWMKREALRRGWTGVEGIDLAPPADFVGDVRHWRDLGLEPHSFDAITAFEVLEHGDFATPIWELLKPDGFFFATTPVPAMDPICKVLERLGLLQRRTSPHSHLTHLGNLRHFTVAERKVKAGISQWAILRPLPDHVA